MLILCSLSALPSSSVRQRPGSIFAVVGAHNLPDRDGQRIGVVRIHGHPGYEGTSLVNDVSVLELSEDVVYSPDVYPVCLQETGEVPAGDCTVTGWGYLQQGRDVQRATTKVKFKRELTRYLPA